MPCPSLTMSQTCLAEDVPVCPVVLDADCVIAEWSSWAECSSSCDGGNKVRNRTVTAPATGAGTDCGLYVVMAYVVLTSGNRCRHRLYGAVSAGVGVQQ